MTRSTLQHILLASCVLAGACGSSGTSAGQAGGEPHAGTAAVGGESSLGKAGQPAVAGQVAGARAAAGSGGAHAGSLDRDAGVCISDLGGRCGGNTREPCACASGLVCTADAGSALPTGDVGGTCQVPRSAGGCQKDADCSLQADYCTGCDCVALGPGESVRACSGPGVRCLADPCANKQPACASGKCVAR